MGRLNIYLNRLEHNLNFIKSISQDEDGLIAVVKANAYGHGILEISKKLVSLGISRLSVASVSEGILLRKMVLIVILWYFTLTLLNFTI